MAASRPERRGEEPGSESVVRSELVRLHRAIWKRQKAEIDASVRGYTQSFRNYEAAYRRRVRKHRGEISYQDVLERAREARIVYVGDYHTHKQSQKAFLKLVHRCMGFGRPVGLALEIFQGSHQPHVDAYLAGRSSERALLRRVDLAGHFFFPIWPGFRPIMEAAKDIPLPVLAIDKDGSVNSLARRDAFAADRIADWISRNRNHQLLVLTGQLHVAPDHLPLAVDKALRRRGLKESPYLVVYQNPADIYWQLTAEGLEHTVDAVGVGPNEVCLINTSPIVAQQSYLNHLHDDDPLDEGLETAPEKAFKEMCRVLCNFLEIDPGDALDRVTVYSLGDLSFLETLASDGKFKAREVAYMKKQILASESYYIPRAQIVYLANPSINHAAEEAAHFLRHLASDDDGDRHGLVDAFYARIVNEALAFFASKIINPRRKCHHPAELKALDETWTAGDRLGLREIDVQAARMTLMHLDVERGLPSRQVRHLYGEPDPDLFNAVTHLLGYILGDKLYYSMVNGKITKAEMRELFAEPFDEEGAAFHVYFYLAGRVRRVRVPRRS